MPTGFQDWQDKADHVGHREQLRERFREAGTEALSDY